MQFCITLKLDCEPQIKIMMLMFGSRCVYRCCTLLTLMLSSFHLLTLQSVSLDCMETGYLRSNDKKLTGFLSLD